MDPYLAELFNTNGHAEKVAYVQEVTGAFIKQAEEEEVDLSGVDEEQLVEAALAWAADMEEGGEGDQDYDPEYLEGPGNIGPKTSEVDFLGRYMAHAYNDELQKIAGHDKEAKSMKAYWSQLKKMPRKFMEHAKGTKVEKMKRQHKGIMEGGLKDSLRVGKGGRYVTPQEASEITKSMGKQMRGQKAKMWGARGALGAGAAGVGAAGVLGAQAALGKKEKKSHIEQLDELAVDRANELLKLAGEGHEFGFEDVAETDEDDLDRVITELAWEKLRDEGYISE
jgi:hypothetical protein